MAISLHNYTLRGQTVPTLVLVDHAPRYLTDALDISVVSEPTRILLEEQSTPELFHELRECERRIRHWQLLLFPLPERALVWEAHPVGVAGVRLLIDWGLKDAYHLELPDGRVIDDAHLNFVQYDVLSLPDAAAWRWQCVNDPQWEV